MLGQLTAISDRLARLEDAQSALLNRTAGSDQPNPTPAESLAASVGTAPLSAAAPAQATATTLAGCLLTWYVDHIWQTAKGKREQNKRAEAKVAVTIMMVLYQEPYQVPAEPPRADATAYQASKHLVWELALQMDTKANQRRHVFDKKKPTRKASFLRKRWRQLRSSHPDAYRSLGAQFVR
ncbi:hypothetical protein PC116_g28153 [Phytophthora cactorum]|uniref:Uncharacterized protein n=2 Tax=Phytophthora cactorum TaxID=29920 RepID=A0A329RJM3_9STRA|nr:hypothetical protein PC111_g23488 [Phytophthora cactorum]KAG2812289.1 hypothetical protein PC113_g23574 [Phytophthora cactorum]KAG2958071.1 hypothetical protein PC118_g23708 [Phytophthora cactorum]KAG3124384.1 hypothetical protein C6341_g26186 [Phytophthora cactorum]KAG4223379.1 hypothetical protein PC116_g28153 [Phytophthora cactorum]